MAKKSKGVFSFADLCGELHKINPDSSILSQNPYATIEDWIGMGNYLLNAQVTGSMFKGIPEGRVTMLSGTSGCLPGDEVVDVYVMKTKKQERLIKYE